ncbi:MAG: ABC transporter permease [Litoreibacter sp.]|nr:ABC transporter permease [Litoreibacter sp.]
MGSAFHKSAEAVAINAAAFAITLGLFGVYVAALGHNPFDVYYILYLGSFAKQISIESTLTNAAPLMLTALCTAIPARAGLLVIGGEGALVVGGVATVLVGVLLGGWPFWAGVLVMGLAGAVAGGLWIAAAGAMRQFRGVNETISTLLLNYIAIAIMYHLISGPIRDYDRVLKTSSWSIPEELRVGVMSIVDVHWGLGAGIVACLVLYVLMRRTTFGFGVDVLGGNQRAAQMAGLPINRMVLICCFFGGAAAGLAGAFEVMAVHGFASESLVVGFGYAGILVAFLARQNPAAIIFVAILLGGISASGGLLQRRFDLPDATTQVLQGLLFVVVLASNAAYGRFKIFQPKEVQPS